MSTIQRIAQDRAPILVVHLDQNVHTMLKEILELEGHDVRTTFQGSEVVCMLRATPRGMIVVTAQVNPQEAVRRLQADGYLSMPFTVDQLIASIAGAQQVLHLKRSRGVAH